MSPSNIHTNLLQRVVALPPQLMHIAPTALAGFPVVLFPDRESLPLVNTQVGNLFKDRFVANRFWYLPAFVPSDDPDRSFSFAAEQTGVDASGNPFNRGVLTLSIKKVKPPDVDLAQKQAPDAEFREIPLTQLSVTLCLTFKNAGGVDQRITYPGSVEARPDGSAQLEFDTILGVAVIIAYENLAQIGGAQAMLSASYNVWQPRKIMPVSGLRIGPQRMQMIPSSITLRQIHLSESHTPPQLSERGAPLVIAPTLKNWIIDFQPRPAEPVQEKEGSSDAPAAAPIEEQTKFDAILSEVGPNKINVIKVVRELTGLGLKEALRFVDEAPKPIKEGVSKEEADKIVEKMAEVGAKVTLHAEADQYIQSIAHVDIPIALDKKYASQAYKQNFTISDGTIKQPILSAQDLKDYDVRQSEFTELHELGNISSKYPSFSQLYIGMLSRTIIAIPAQYGIISGSAGCAAVCAALIDSSPASASGCRFQFTFSLGPVISPIDFLQLSRDIDTHPNLKHFSLQLPSLFDSSIPQMLASSFIDSCVYSSGPSPNRFSLVVDIKDDPEDTKPHPRPAVAKADLFIEQLSTIVALPGRFGLKLDDYHTPIEANVVLALDKTSGTDELGITFDESRQSIVLVNRSPFDLFFRRFALCTPSGLTTTPLQLSLASQKTTTLPLPSEHTELSVFVECSLALEKPLSEEKLDQYLTFVAEDVQVIQYDVAVNAWGVSFKERGISRIDVQIHFADPKLAQIAVPPLTLSPDREIDSAHILVPVVYAISSLAATLTFTVKLVDLQQSPLPSFTLENDFVDHPTLILTNAELVGVVPN